MEVGYAYRESTRKLLKQNLVTSENRNAELLEQICFNLKKKLPELEVKLENTEVELELIKFETFKTMISLLTWK